MHSLIFANWCLITSYHASLLYNTSIGTGCPNKDAQFNRVSEIHKLRIDKTAAILTWYTVCKEVEQKSCIACP